MDEVAQTTLGLVTQDKSIIDIYQHIIGSPLVNSIRLYLIYEKKASIEYMQPSCYFHSQGEIQAYTNQNF